MLLASTVVSAARADFVGKKCNSRGLDENAQATGSKNGVSCPLID